MSVSTPASRRRRRRLIGTVFWTVAILVTALAWAGLSLKDLLAAVAF